MRNVEIVAHSKNEQGDELISVLCVVDSNTLKTILSEHKDFTITYTNINQVEFKDLVEQVNKNPFIPIAWQKEHKGMQGSEYFNEEESEKKEAAWWVTKKDAIASAKLLHSQGVTKQLCNRLLEPFMWTTMLITGSKEGWDNFFSLRNPVYEFQYNDDTPYKTFASRKELTKWYQDEFSTEDSPYNSELEWLSINKGQAEIHMMALAESIYDVINESTPEQLAEGMWHIPFMGRIDSSKLKSISGKDVTEEMIKISTAMAARTSYTVVRDEKEIDYQKMIELHDKCKELNHSSVFEHCARAMTNQEHYQFRKGWLTNTEESIKETAGWCRNFKGFIPYRHIIETGG